MQYNANILMNTNDTNNTKIQMAAICIIRFISMYSYIGITIKS